MKYFLTVIISLCLLLTGCSGHPADSSSAGGPESPEPFNTSFDERIKDLKDFKIKDIAASDTFTLFLTDDGCVLACGSNGFGELGQGNTEQYSRPHLVETGEKIKLIDVGQAACLAVGVSNSVYIWGLSLDMGEDYLLENKITEPQKIPFSENITDISVSLDHALLLTDKGEVYSFGRNHGALGYETDDVYVSEPRKINISGIKAIETTSNGSVFLTEDNSVYVCGNNQYGEFGDKISGAAPRRLPLKFSVKQIAAANSSVFLLSDKGEVYSSGLNADGVLGIDSELGSVSEFTKVKTDAKIKKIYSSLFHVCHMLTEDGKLLACGTNLYDELLLGRKGNAKAPKPVKINKKIKTFYGKGSAKFLVDSKDNIWAYGQSNYGQLVYSSKDLNPNEPAFQKKPVKITQKLFTE